ncbi:MAG TPA: metalloregulator ArsR/SmtB family transcription factor [Solirubrobacterales bacterium]|nr:metalloregulator ArsR/SmtB family transcription factor [Solirubrobacterales bacterium]
MDNVFEVIADPSRRGILDLLVDRPHDVGEIVARTGLSQPNASRHLRILREVGLVLLGGGHRSGMREGEVTDCEPPCLDALSDWLDGAREAAERPTADRHRLAPYPELEARYQRLHGNC